MISEVTNLAHRLLPEFNQSIDVQYTQGIKAATALVDTLILGNKGIKQYDASLYWKNGHRYLTMTISGSVEALDNVSHALLSNCAMYIEDNDTISKRHGETDRKLELTFSSFAGLGYICTIPDSEAKTQEEVWERINRSSGDMSMVVYNTINLASALLSSDKDSARWFVDRLPIGEQSGEHMLAIQNFMYRIINRPV